MELLAPGTTDESLDAAAAAVDLTFPEELRAWWRWHDGLRSDPGAAAEAYEIGPGFRLLSLEQAVERYRKSRSQAAALAADRGAVSGSPDHWWDPSWFPFLVRTTGGHIIAADCSVERDAASPIRAIDWHDPGWEKIVAGSVAEMVDWWIEALEIGAWRFEHQSKVWARDWDRIPDQRDPLA